MITKLMSLIICFVFCFHLFSFGQTKIEDLEKELNRLPEDIHRVDFLCRLSFAIFTSSPEKAEKYALEAIELGKKLGYKKGVARGYSKLAISFHIRGNYTLALENYQKSLNLYKEMGDPEGAAKTLNNLGILFLDQGNYQKSLEYYFNALDVFEKDGKKIPAAGVLNNIGEIYKKLDKLNQALEYYNKSFEIYSNMDGFEREKAHVLINIGRIHFNKRDMSFALKYYQQALYISLNFDEKSYIAACYKNIGEIYLSQKNFKKALKYLNKSLEIIEEIGDKHSIAECFLSIGKIYSELRNLLLSKSYNIKSLDIAQKIGAKEIEMKALRNLSDQEFALGNHAAALDYLKKYSVLKDKIFGIETKKQLAELETKYDTEKKEKENIRLRMRNEIQEQIIQKQLYVGILVTVCLILVVILAIVFFRGRQKQKKANLLLLQEKAYVDQLFESAQEAIVLADEDGRVLRVNSEFIRLFGYTIDEVIGSSLDDLIAPEKYYDEAVSTTKKVLGGEKVAFETVRRCKDRTLHNVSVLASPIIVDGESAAVYAIYRDITELKLAEKALEERSKDLAEANIRLKELDRLKSMFIASMSHELRTPLNSIIGFSGIILQGMSGEITGEQRKQLILVKNSANHLLALINDVIDVSKIEAGQIELIIEEFNLSDIMQEVNDSFKFAVEKKGLKLSFEMPERLVIKSDERRTKQVIMNLVSNAIKFTDIGEIEIKAAKKDEGVDISVRDNGIGIEKKDIDKLFKAFSRIYNKDMLKEGTGLGLYLSRKIADLLGGEISAKSKFGRGSKFTFKLPLKYKEERRNESR